MNDLLVNPAVQSGVAPFAVGLVVAAALARTRLLALAQVAGFLTLAALAIGLSFESLTATKKLVLIGIATGAGALLIEWRGAPRWAGHRAVLLALAAASVWMLWRLLVHKEIGAALLAAGLAAAYVSGLAGTTLFVGQDPVRGAAAGLMVGLGTGALAVLGASALLGLVGISAGAAAGATLLVQMARGQPAEVGRTISLPASAISALAGVLAVLSASLPAYSLLPVLAAPLTTLLVPLSVRPVWLRAFLCALAALGPMLVAIALAWFLPST